MTTVSDGSTSYHPYELQDADGVTVANVEALEYRLSDALNTLVDWTAIDLLPEGTITVSAEYNTMKFANDTERYLTLRATHNGGEIITDEQEYTLTDLTGIETL